MIIVTKSLPAVHKHSKTSNIRPFQIVLPRKNIEKKKHLGG